MTTTYITEPGYFTATFSDFIVGKDVMLSTAGPTLRFGNTSWGTITVQGSVVTTSSDVALDIPSTNMTEVLVTRSGHIQSTSGVGMSVGGSTSDILNKGLVEGATGIALEGRGFFLQNSGQILGHQNNGVYLESAEDGTHWFKNMGDIAGQTNGIHVFGSGGVDSTHIYNSGSISGANNYGIFVETGTTSDSYIENHGRTEGLIDGVNIGGWTVEIENTGKIIGQTGYGIRSWTQQTLIENSGNIKGLVGLFTYNFATVENTGKIVGVGGTAVEFNWSSQLINEGKIIGDVLIGGFSNVRNTGLIKGDVSFSLTSQYTASGEGEVTGIIYLSTGNDEAKGGDLADRIQGQAGDDTIIGGKGDDVLLGGADEDRINGGKGRDVMTGGAIVGWGDGAEDIFVFAGKRTGRDIITDFEDGIDYLDLTAIDPFIVNYNLDAALSQDGDDVVINLNKLLGQKGKIILQNTNAEDITLDDFVFNLL